MLIEIKFLQMDIGDEAEMVPAKRPRHAGAFPDDDAYRKMRAGVERQRRTLDLHTADQRVRIFLTSLHTLNRF